MDDMREDLGEPLYRRRCPAEERGQPARQTSQRATISVSDLIPQTHQGANDDLEVDSYWLGPDGDIEPATFLLGDLCTWDYEQRGYKLMKDARQVRH